MTSQNARLKDQLEKYTGQVYLVSVDVQMTEERRGSRNQHQALMVLLLMMRVIVTAKRAAWKKRWKASWEA